MIGKRKILLITAFLIAVFGLSVLFINIGARILDKKPYVDPKEEYIDRKREQATKQLNDAKDSDSTRIDNVDDALKELGADQ